MKAAYLGLEICIANPVENKYVSPGSNIFCSLIFVLMSKAAEPVVSNFGKAILVPTSLSRILKSTDNSASSFFL